MLHTYYMLNRTSDLQRSRTAASTRARRTPALLASLPQAAATEGAEETSSSSSAESQRPPRIKYRTPGRWASPAGVAVGTC